MTQKVLKVGSSAAVTIPKKSLAVLGLKIGDRVAVEMSQSRKMVSIKPLSALSAKDQRILRLTLSFISRYRKDLEALSGR